MSPAFFAEKHHQPAFGGPSWSGQPGHDIVLPPYDGSFPKQELFDDVDLSSIPMSILSDPVLEASNLDSVEFGEIVPGPQHTWMVPLDSTPCYPPQTSTAAMDEWTILSQRRHSNFDDAPIREPRASEEGCMREVKRNSSVQQQSPRKRKSVSSAAGSSSPRSSTSPPPSVLQPRKATHNMIEKRYRTNLNDKIAALRDAVPSLRVMVHRMGREAEGLDEGDLLAEAESLGGLAPAHKLNKATVLSKATEYIAHLERNNAVLRRENSHLKNRVAGLEMMVTGRGPGFVGDGGVWGY
ncbi:Sterol regulatory element-binding protein-like protein [Hapsidospora chrysogenum ATCC 11550]|uniref:Sterol regulatory element-binding protein-like protein n=1 Tax=Hapsidospora chrysogenum (strain ATCC 11550 / CBS 779.69 / DSM 880 / IAM 14645 / JCM 23072 / IMI 49137) TaxID=857340 RepID=A0A086SWW9_HAPC1|nr:Sterol regulatory element-binding protein-like protein [Hapsidospora chrysogenum ATCC 11550]